MKRTAGGFAGTAALLAAAWLAAVAGLAAPVPAAAQLAVRVDAPATLDAAGLPRSVFMPGEQIRYRARVEGPAAAPYRVRLVVTGSGWYEVLDAGPFSGTRTVDWGGPGDARYTSGEAYPGKVSLCLDVRSEAGDPAVLQGTGQGYFTIRCPEGLPAFPGEPLPVGVDPWDMAFSKDHRFLYVTSQSTRTVTVIDLDLWEIAQVLPPDYEEINRKILECQVACAPLDFECYDACIYAYAVVARPAGLAPADLASAGQRMVLSDYQAERIFTIEREGSRHWLSEDYIQVPRTPPLELHMNLSGVVANASNQVFATDLADNQVLRMNLDPPHDFFRINLRYIPNVGNRPMSVILDPDAPNRNLYVLAVQVLKITQTGLPLEILEMERGNASVAMSLNPDPARPWLYALRGPAGPIDPARPKTSAYVFYWNLEDPTPEGGSGPVYYDASLWDIDVIQKGPLRGRVAYVLDAYQGEVRLLCLESRSLMRGCGIPVTYGVGHVLEDPVRDRIYVTNSGSGDVVYLAGE